MLDEAKHSNPFFSKVEKCHLAPSATNGTIYFVELESLMMHAKFQDHRTSGSGEHYF